MDMMQHLQRSEFYPNPCTESDTVPPQPCLFCRLNINVDINFVKVKPIQHSIHNTIQLLHNFKKRTLLILLNKKLTIRRKKVLSPDKKLMPVRYCNKLTEKQFLPSLTSV